MNTLLPLAVRAHLSARAGTEYAGRFVRDRIERLRDPDERGADIFEWAGMLILVAAIIAALYGLGIVNKVKDEVNDALKQIFDSDPNTGKS